MPRNVEIKARVHDLEELLKKAEEVSKAPGEILCQEDVFFNVPNGRLKLREELNKDGNEAWLLFYQRPDSDGPRLSQYQKCPVQDSKGLRSVLTEALGEKGDVQKERRLFMAGQTRIHVDTVRDLGHFMELEVVLREDQTEEEGQEIATSLMQQLGISSKDLVTVAYTDLLQAASYSGSD